MKIEIEWTIDDVLDLLKSIAWMPRETLKEVEKTLEVTPIFPTVPDVPKVEEDSRQIAPDPVDLPSEEIPTPRKARTSGKSEGGGGGKLSRKIDVFVWEEWKWFTIDASCSSISSAARHIGVPSAANIHAYVDSWKIYKGKYKFISRKA